MLLSDGQPGRKPQNFCSAVEQALHTLLVCRIDQCARPQVSFALLRFFGQDMAVIGFLTFEFPGPGYLEPFLGAAIGFHLRHKNLSI